MAETEIEPWEITKNPLRAMTMGFNQWANLNDWRNTYSPGTLEFFPGQTYADFSPYTLEALEGMRERARAAVPAAAGTLDELHRTMGGAYLPGGDRENPYLQSAIDYATEPVLRNLQNNLLPGIMDQYQAAGRTGMSPGAIERMGDVYRDVMRDVSGIGAAMSSQAYGDERMNQMRAMGLMPQTMAGVYAPYEALRRVGSEFEGQEQRGIGEAMARHEFEQYEPINRMGTVYPYLMGMASGFPQTQQKDIGGGMSPLGWASNIGGLALGALGAAGQMGLFGGAPAAAAAGTGATGGQFGGTGAPYTGYGGADTFNLFGYR